MASFFDLAEDVINSIVYESGEFCERDLMARINAAKVNGEITVGEAEYLRESVKGAIGRYGKEALRDPKGATTKRVSYAASIANDKLNSAYANTIGKNATADKVAKTAGKVVGTTALSSLKAVPAAASLPAKAKLKKMEKKSGATPQEIKELEIQRQKVKNIRKKVMGVELGALTVAPMTPILAAAVGVCEKLCGDHEVSSNLVEAISAVGKKVSEIKLALQGGKDAKTARQWERAVNGTGKYGDGAQAAIHKKFKSVVADLDKCMDRLAKSDLGAQAATESTSDCFSAILEASQNCSITDEERDLLIQFMLHEG